MVLALALAPGLLEAVFGGVLMMSFSSPKVELLVGTVASVFVNSSKRDDDGEPGWLNESARARSWIWGLEMIWVGAKVEVDPIPRGSMGFGLGVGG